MPDACFEYEAGSKRSGFFLEMDLGTMATKRFRDKVKAFLIYKLGSRRILCPTGSMTTNALVSSSSE